MFLLANQVEDSSNTVDLCSEQQMIQDISSFAPPTFAAIQPDESMVLMLRYRPPKMDKTLRDLWRADRELSLDQPDWYDKTLLSDEDALIVDNLQHQMAEPEDAILVGSGILPHLVAQARQVPPSLDWERDLDEL